MTLDPVQAGIESRYESYLHGRRVGVASAYIVKLVDGIIEK